VRVDEATLSVAPISESGTPATNKRRAHHGAQVLQSCVPGVHCAVRGLWRVLNRAVHVVELRRVGRNCLIRRL